MRSRCVCGPSCTGVQACNDDGSDADRHSQRGVSWLRMEGGRGGGGGGLARE